jgi:fatty-acyl-CoA synthase
VTGGDPEALFHKLRAGCDGRTDRLALTFLAADLSATHYSFARLFERVDDVATRLDRLGHPRGTTIGILLHSQEAQVVHYLAALSCGLVPAILTPPNRKLDRKYYARTMEVVLDYCRFAVVLTDLAGVRTTSMVVEPDGVRVRQRSEQRSESEPVCGAFLQFSSGTTGIKRGVLVSAEAAIAQIDVYARAIGLDDEDRILGWLPLYHDMGFMTSVNMALACGVHSLMMQPLDWVADPVMYVRAASIHRATLGWHPNFAFSLMADRAADTELAGLDLSSLRGLVNCSEPVTFTSQERFRRRFSGCGLRDDVFWGCYAMAEATFALTHGNSRDDGYLDAAGFHGSPLKPDAAPFVSVGRPLPGVDLRITDSANRPCDDRTVGEAHVRCPFLFTAYYNNPDATRDAFIDGWYKTGDLGYRAGENYYICARTKDVIIVGGVNVYANDVEEVASRVEGLHPGRVAAFGAFDLDAQSERVVVLAETDRDGSERASLAIEVRTVLASTFQITALEVHLVPSGWLVKSSAGKMARHATREKWKVQGFDDQRASA